MENTHRITVRFNDEEYTKFQKKFENSQCKKQSTFIKKMINNGIIIKLDMTELIKMRRLILNIANNLNQMAKRANETGSIYGADIEDIQKRVEEFWQQQVYITSTLRKFAP